MLRDLVFRLLMLWPLVVLCSRETMRGPVELIASGEDGYLVNPMDTTHMANLLTSLAKDRQEMQRLATNAKLSSSRFTWNNHIRGVVEDWS